MSHTKLCQCASRFIRNFILGIVLQFILTGALLILIFLRLMANYYHYQNEQGFHKRNVRDVRKSRVYYCHIYLKVGDFFFQQSSCCGCLCFAQYIIGIVITLFLWFWTQIFTQEIAGTTAIVFVCWDVVMLCVLFELLLSKSTYPLAQYEETGEGNENLYFKVEIL